MCQSSTTAAAAAAAAVSWSLTSLLQHKYGYIRDEAAAAETIHLITVLFTKSL